MTARVACTVDLPDLARAVAARGLGLVPYAPGVAAAAGLFAGTGEGVARIRALGWQAPLLLLLPAEGSVAHALDAGADDAMPASATAEEVAARLAARIRRPEIVLGELRIDPVERRVTRAGRRYRCCLANMRCSSTWSARATARRGAPNCWRPSGAWASILAPMSSRCMSRGCAPSSTGASPCRCCAPTRDAATGFAA